MGYYGSYHTCLLVCGPVGMVFLLNAFILISLNSCHTLMMTLQALVYDPGGASDKWEFIKIWLDHYHELLFFFTCHPVVPLRCPLKDPFSLLQNQHVLHIPHCDPHYLPCYLLDMILDLRLQLNVSGAPQRQVLSPPSELSMPSRIDHHGLRLMLKPTISHLMTISVLPPMMFRKLSMLILQMTRLMTSSGILVSLILLLFVCS
jgi:hypothetical protein